MWRRATQVHDIRHSDKTCAFYWLLIIELMRNYSFNVLYKIRKSYRRSSMAINCFNSTLHNVLIAYAKSRFTKLITGECKLKYKVGHKFRYLGKINILCWTSFYLYNVLYIITIVLNTQINTHFPLLMSTHLHSLSHACNGIGDTPLPAYAYAYACNDVDACSMLSVKVSCNHANAYRSSH